MRVRAQRWQRLIAVLVGVPAGLGLVLLAPGASAAPTPAPTTVSTESDVPRHPIHHAPPVSCPQISAFRGQNYCLISLEDLSSTRYGVGTRVLVGQAIVYAVDDRHVYIAQQRGPVCGEEGTCDFYLVSATVPWSGSLPKPPVDFLVDLYGRSTKDSLTPISFEVVGLCDDPYNRPC